MLVFISDRTPDLPQPVPVIKLGALTCEVPLSFVSEGAYVADCCAIEAQYTLARLHGLQHHLGVTPGRHRPCPTFPRLLTPFARASPVGRV